MWQARLLLGAPHISLPGTGQLPPVVLLGLGVQVGCTGDPKGWRGVGGQEASCPLGRERGGGGRCLDVEPERRAPQRRAQRRETLPQEGHRLHWGSLCLRLPRRTGLAHRSLGELLLWEKRLRTRRVGDGRHSAATFVREDNAVRASALPRLSPANPAPSHGGGHSERGDGCHQRPRRLGGDPAVPAARPSLRAL